MQVARVAVQRVEDVGELQPDEDEQHRLEDEDEDLPEAERLEARSSAS